MGVGIWFNAWGLMGGELAPMGYVEVVGKGLPAEGGGCWACGSGRDRIKAGQFTGMAFAKTACVGSAKVSSCDLGREIDVSGLVVVQSALEGSAHRTCGLCTGIGGCGGRRDSG